jgi:hypothetical protein
VDRDRLGHLIILTGMENVKFPEMVSSVVEYVQEDRGLGFGWHQVAMKI